MRALRAPGCVGIDLAGIPANETGFAVLREGRLVGLITTNDLRRFEAEGREATMITDAKTRKVVHSHPDQTLDTVVLKLAQRELSQVPVVSRMDDTRLLGIITLRDIARLRTHFLRGKGDAVDAWIRMVCLNRLTGHSSGFFTIR